MGSLLIAFSIFSVLASWSTVHGSNVDRIVGGEVAAPGEFPWQVSIRIYGRHSCGGTLVSLRHVLTSAHCAILLHDTETTTVVTGTNSLTSGGETHGVRNITWDQEYIGASWDSWYFDVGILTLMNEITETNLQRPIALATENTPAGVEAVVSGWGRVFHPSSSFPVALQKMTMTLLNTSECQSYWNLKIYDSQICGLRRFGSGVCHGDGGGPLIYNDQVVGIVSWGDPCGNGIPDVYTRVFVFLDWIGRIVHNRE